MYKEAYYIWNFKSSWDSNEEETKKNNWEEVEEEIEQNDQIFLNAHTIKSQKTQQNDSKKAKCLMMKLLMHTYHF